MTLFCVLKSLCFTGGITPKRRILGFNDSIIIDGDGRPTFTLDFVSPRFRPRLSQTPGFLGSHDPLGSPENANKLNVERTIGM